MKRSAQIPAAVALLGILVACAGTPDTARDTRAQVRAAQATLESFLDDPQALWLRENLPRARALAISPGVTRAALGIGGSSGEVLVMARDGDSGRWAGPAFYTLREGNVGFQAGVEVGGVAAAGTDMVALASSRGVYAGASLAGAVIRPDEEANQAFYGKPASPTDILLRRTVVISA